METTMVPTDEHETVEAELSLETQADTLEVAPALAMPAEPDELSEGVVAGAPRLSRRSLLVSGATAALTFGWGLGIGYWVWGRTPTPSVSASAAPASPPVAAVLTTAVPTAEPTAQPLELGLPHSYMLPVAYGTLGPQLIKAGAFTYDSFAQLYAQAGQPLTSEQEATLRTGSDRPVVIDHANAYFLLNFFWATGLANYNPVLESDGALMKNSNWQIDKFASTGGWSLAAKQIYDLYSSAEIVKLSPEQQIALEDAAGAVYRPCCNNSTAFPDCNHGMAMLGLLELMAAKDLDVNTMLDAAKMVNSFWFPGQSRELALYHQAQTGEDFPAIAAKEAVGAERFSSRGFAEVHNWLAANGKLEAPNQDGSSCGV
jgi:hypothetical protein